MAPRIGIMLSGCGVFDGSEIHEAVFTLLAVDRAGAQAVFLAPNVPQAHVVDHAKGEVAAGESRNVLAEAARIARGKIRDAASVRATDLDALIFPGGFGAAKNLCTFAFDGPDCDVNPEVERLVGAMHAAGKPLGFLCIAPALAAKLLGGEGVALTIGNDAETAAALESLGAHHVDCPVTELCHDEKHNVVSAPAYMYGEARPSEVAEGIEKLVRKVVQLAAQRVAAG